MKAKTRTTGRRRIEGCGGKQEIEVRVVARGETKRFDGLLREHHYLKESRPVGDFLRQVAVCNGEWVALLTWGSPCYALRDRDAWIGWTPTLRAERQKLIVQNRRFLLLGKRGEHPNRASQVLACATRVLPEQWQQAFGYQPVMLETFTDIEQFAGTCYKAAGWEPVGMSQGFSKHRGDFFVSNDRPKRLWMKQLVTAAKDILCGSELPEGQQAGGQSSAHGVMPFPQIKCRSLMEALQTVPDPRCDNTQFRIGSLLAIIAMALLSGARDVSQIHRFGWRLKQAQRAKIGLPRKRGTKFYKTPGYKVYYELLRRVELDAFARVLSQWLAQHQGSLPGCLAMDGKMVRDTVGVLSLVDHETGAPSQMAAISKKEGEGHHCEQKVAQRLLRKGEALDNKLITADALHCQRDTARQIVDKGADYLLQIKGNQKTLHARAKRKTSDIKTPFLKS